MNMDLFKDHDGAMWVFSECGRYLIDMNSRPARRIRISRDTRKIDDAVSKPANTSKPSFS